MEGVKGIKGVTNIKGFVFGEILRLKAYNAAYAAHNAQQRGKEKGGGSIYPNAAPLPLSHK